MTILWDTQLALNALYGGIAIGIAASLLVTLNGRIAGISGIVGGLLKPEKGNVAWRIAFIVGLLISPLVYGFFAPLPTVTLQANSSTIIIAGLLVGFGTRLGNGCTSGHGVCGIARFSTRSIIATLIFMVTGMATVFIMHTVKGG